jgi:hypothetical protein
LRDVRPLPLVKQAIPAALVPLSAHFLHSDPEGRLHHHAKVSESLLKKIREGAAASTQMSRDHANILIDQGLIEC